MTLHEQYQALIRRGMPEHERLMACAWPGTDGYWAQPPANPFINSPGPRVHESDARDLITMHALRWFLGLKLTDFFGYPYPGLVVTPGMNIPEAILAATEHREPDTTPPGQ